MQIPLFQRRLFFADRPAQFGKFQSKRAPIYIAQALGDVINRNRCSWASDCSSLFRILRLAQIR